MAVRISTYSGLIAGLKVLLPLAALALLSSLFLLSRTITPGQEVPFLDDASEIPTSDSIAAPYYSGSTPEGHAVLITAETARPMEDDPEGFIAQKLDATFDLIDGSRLHVVADEAQVNEPDDYLGLSGSVVITSSAGYVVRTEKLISSLHQIRAESPGAVNATSPMGVLDAGQFRVTQSDENNNVQMVFTNGVKLIYEPAKQESKDP